MPTNLLNDNEIECARCGEIFSINLTRCPNCGVNLYEPDDGTDAPSPTPIKSFTINLPNRIRFPVALFIGWLASAVGTFVIYLIARLVAPSPLTETAALIIIILSTSVGAFWGGFAAFRVALQRPVLLGMLVGLLDVFLAAFLAVEVRGEVLSLSSLGSLPLWLPLILVAISGVYATRKMLGNYIENFILQDPKSEDELYFNLLMKVRYEEDVAERLIEYERKRLPHADRLTWIRNAIARWEQDNR